MISIQNADNALKSFYLDAITQSLDTKTNAFLAQLAHSGVNVVGKDVKKLVACGVNGGVCAGSETGDLPASQNSKRLVFTTSLKNLYGTLEITDKALRAAAGSEGAFVNLLNEEMQTLIHSASFNFGRMLFGDGSGKLTGASEFASGQKVNVDSARNLVEGMIVDFCDANGEPITGGTGRKIVAVDRKAKTVTYSGNDLSASGTTDVYLYAAGSQDQELTGLEAIFGDGELYGNARAAGSVMKPYRNEVGGAISDSMIQTAIDSIEEESGGKINFIICSWGVKRALANYLRENSVMPQTVELEGGYKTISYNGIPVVADRFCPEGTMYLLNTEDFKIHQLTDWKWLEGDDGKILKQIPGKPVYSATLVKYAELMCERPSGQGVIKNITEA